MRIYSLMQGFAARLGGKEMIEAMTDRQYDGILQMIEMILEGCKDIEEAKRKISELREGSKEKDN